MSPPPRDAGPEPDGPAPPPPPPDESCQIYEGLANEALISRMHRELHNTYVPLVPEEDLGGNPNRYTTARRHMFLDVEPIEQDGERGVECVYTGSFFAMEPGVEPVHEDMNTEHVRPRSELDPDQDSLMYSHEQSDLHHLYPALPGANSTRGSYPFGEVEEIEIADWMPSLYGLDAAGRRVWEPRAERKGDLARALFYMTARWGLDLSDSEEEVLKRWNDQDPPDAREQARHEAAAALQGDRNPFIDCPGLAGEVADFARFEPLDTNENLASP